MASRSWNRVELIGNLTRDPELRYTPQGSAVVSFSIATNRTFISDGEKKEEADFHRIVAWNKLAELCSQLLKKGNRVFVSGRLQNRSWEDQSGQTKQVTEIVIEDMILLTSKSGGDGEYSSSRDGGVSSRQSDEMPGKDSRQSPVVSHQPDEKAEETKEEPNPSTHSEDSGQAGAQDKEAAKEEKSEKKPEKEEVEDLDDLPF